jgi:hypothetical protein
LPVPAGMEDIVESLLVTTVFLVLVPTEGVVEGRLLNTGWFYVFGRYRAFGALPSHFGYICPDSL